MNLQKAIEHCRRQDRVAQKYLFDRYSEGMLMMCMRYVRNLPDAEELMLNGFYNFYDNIGRFVYSSDAGVTAWLRKIMVNECLVCLRKRGDMKMATEEEGIETADADDLLARLGAADIFRLIRELPDGYRTVFNLFAVEGYNHKEISVLLGISEGTSKSQLSKARAMLQKRISTDNVKK